MFIFPFIYSYFFNHFITIKTIKDAGIQGKQKKRFQETEDIDRHCIFKIVGDTKVRRWKRVQQPRSEGGETTNIELVDTTSDFMTKMMRSIIDENMAL